MHLKPLKNLYLTCLVCLISTLLGLCFLNVNLAQAQDKLIELDAAAQQAYKRGQFSEALEKYAELQDKLADHGMANRQADLLYNQALIHLELQEYGQAAAKLQQIQVIDPSPDSAKLLTETRYIIEYQAYRKHPNAAFVRGSSNDFTLWLQSHQIKQRPLAITTIASWTFFLASLLGLCFLRKRKRQTWIAKFIASLTGIFFLVLFTHIVLYKITDKNSFAVITSTDGIRKEPRLGSEPLRNPTDLNGMVVRILTQNDRWALVERSDKKTAWIPKEDLYILSGVE